MFRVTLILHLIALGVCSIYVKYYWNETFGVSDVCPLLAGCRLHPHDDGSGGDDGAHFEVDPRDTCKYGNKSCKGDSVCCTDCQRLKMITGRRSDHMARSLVKHAVGNYSRTIEFINDLGHTYGNIACLYSMLFLRLLLTVWHLQRNGWRQALSAKMFKVINACGGILLLFVLLGSVVGFMYAAITLIMNKDSYRLCHTITVLHISTIWIYGLMILEYLFVIVPSTVHDSAAISAMVRKREAQISGKPVIETRAKKPTIKCSLLKRLILSCLSWVERLSILWWIIATIYCIGVAKNLWDVLKLKTQK